MKGINILKIFIVVLAVVFTACEDVKYEESGSPLSVVPNAKAEVVDGDIKITWDRPLETDSFGIQLTHNGEIIEIGNSPLEYTIENIEVNIDHSLTLKVKALNQSSQGITLHVVKEGTNPVSNMRAIREGNNIKVSWTLPVDYSNVSAVEINWGDNNVELKPLSASDTTYTIQNVVDSKRYTIGVRTKNESLMSHYVYAVVNSQRYAFVSTAESLSEIEDDDEKAAAQWFINNYPTGELLPVSKIASGDIDLSAISVIWIHVDRVGDGKLPASLLANQVVNSITEYYKNGGNIFLSIHATQYITSLGRMASDRSPGIIGSGTGGVGSDTWSFNPDIGMVYDHFSHPIYKGLSTVSDFGHPSIPLIGPGHREDHNCMWDLNSLGYSIPADGENIVKAFEKENSASVLGTWGHVTDFCCAGIVEFSPTNSYKGRCIAIGLAAYEWNQNTGTNMYQSSIEKMTSNIIDYLK